MHQANGDLLSVGSELFVDKPLIHNHFKLDRFSSNRVDLKIFSVNQNDSGLYTCMYNDEKLSSFLLEIFSKYSQSRLDKLSVIHMTSFKRRREKLRFFSVKCILEIRR